MATIPTFNPLVPGLTDPLGLVFHQSPNWLSWQSNLLLVAAIDLGIVSLLYMISIAFNLTSIKSWAKGEYMQVIVSILLVAALLNSSAVIWSVMVGVVSELFTSHQPEFAMAQAGGLSARYDPFTFAQAYIDQVFIDCEKTIYKTLYSINYFYRTIGKLNTEPIGTEPLGGWYTSLYTGFFEYVMGHLNGLLMLQYVQYRFLSVIKYTMPLLIQVGLLLRVFPLTRGAGGLLIAIGFGFFVVYPISIAMLITLQPAPSASFCTGFQPPPLLDVRNGLCIDSISALEAARNKATLAQAETDDLVQQLKTFLPVFYLQATFFPLISLVITFTFIRQTGTLFGADLNEIGRGLVKLI